MPEQPENSPEEKKSSRIDVLIKDAFHDEPREGTRVELILTEKETGVFSVELLEDGNIHLDDTEKFYFKNESNNPEVQILDEEDEQYEVLKRSQHVKIGDVELTPWEFRGPSIEKIKEALKKVRVERGDSQDI